jgi:hypothetical protein
LPRRSSTFAFVVAVEDAVQWKVGGGFEEGAVEASSRSHHLRDAIEAKPDVVQRDVREERLTEREVERVAEVAVEALGLA